MDNLLLGFCNENAIDYRLDEPLSNHTTFKIGGNAKYFLEPKSKTDLEKTVVFFKENNIPYFVLGKGSNLLVSDKGINGVVISTEKLKGSSFAGEYVTVCAGESLASFCRLCRDNGLSGLEFAYGIPGSVGGAVYMNAGAYGGQISDCLTFVFAVMPDGTIREFRTDECDFSYRHSIFCENGAVIFAATFVLKPDSKEAIYSRMEDFSSRRKEKQPLEYPSAGSTFKRPEGYFAGALIEQCGLKGASVGDAEVSVKHAGFVINKGNATCKDVLGLIEKIKTTVKNETGVDLEPEVIFVGER